MTQKPTDELTPEQLRRELAELDGYRIILPSSDAFKDVGVWEVCHHHRCIGNTFGDTVNEAWHGALTDGVYDDEGGHATEQIPNWPGNPGAALALCLEIARERSYGLRIEPLPIYFDEWKADTYTAFWAGSVICSALGAGESEALSRLAHAALTKSET